MAVITGAACGIGRAAAVALARRGAAVQEAGGRWLSVTADQRDIDAVRSAARIEREWGGADTVFANAGIQAFRPILEMDDRDWHD